MDIELLRDKHKNKTCYIVGKGPSLRFLNESYFNTDEGNCVIALNEAIEKVEELNLKLLIYSQYKDGNWPEPQCTKQSCEGCWMIPPKKAILLLHEFHTNNCMRDYPLRYMFNNNHYGLRDIDQSIMSAMANGLLFGCNFFVFLCMDSVFGDHREFIPGKLTMNNHNYIPEVNNMLEYISKNRLNHQFITPKE